MILLYLANAVGATQRQTAQTPLAIPVIRSQIDAPIRDRQARGQRARKFRQGTVEAGTGARRRNQDPILNFPTERSRSATARPRQGGARAEPDASPDPETPETRETLSLEFSLAGPCRLSEKNKNASWGGTNPHRQRQPAALSHT